MMRSMGLVAAALALAACGDKAEAPKAGATAKAQATATVTPVSTGPTVRTEIREFRDWRAVCDNGNYCVAWTGSDAAGWLRIAIEAGPNEVPTFSAGSWALGEVGEEPANLRLRIDGKDLPLHVGAKDAANAAATATHDRGLIAAVASGRSVALSAGSESVELPAAGASAALLWIDERQGRLGTTTALIRKGERPGSSVPAAPALPVVRAAPAVAQTGFEGAADPMEDEPKAGLKVPAAIEALGEVKACRAENNEYLNKAVLAARLDASTVLWGIPCGSGAYNATYVLYLARPDGTGVRTAPLPTREPRTSEAEGDLWLVNPQYDAEAQTLTVFPRGRGLGDCGTITTWTWTATGFVLKEERFMGDCWGMSWVLWPTTWRTQ